MKEFSLKYPTKIHTLVKLAYNSVAYNQLTMKLAYNSKNKHKVPEWSPKLLNYHIAMLSSVFYILYKKTPEFKHKITKICMLGNLYTAIDT